MFKTLLLETDTRGVAKLTLNRPEKRNALSAQMIAELTQAASQVAADPAIRVVVLTGAGQSFCAGGDLGWMRDQMGMDADTRKAEARKLAVMLGALNTLPKPLIGKIQGNAFGGGVGLACICDLAIGVEGVKFGLTETRLGLIPATIGPYVLARMGEGRARQVFMSSRLFEAQEAERLGILSKAVSRDGLDAAVEEEVTAYLSCAPGAVSAAKSLALKLSASVPQSSIDMSIDALAERWQDSEAEEGTAAFFEKRKASWAD